MDLSALDGAYETECGQYFFETALWVDAAPGQLLGPPEAILEIDCLTITLDELKATQEGRASLSIDADGEAMPFNSILGWFTTDFRGSPASPAAVPVTLTTEPTDAGATHWGQQQFHLERDMDAPPGSTVRVGWAVSRQRQNQRLLNVALDLAVQRPGDDGAAAPLATRRCLYRID